MTSYTYDPDTLTFPPPAPYDLPTCNPTPLAPLHPPPTVTPPANLPSPPRRSAVDRWYTLSTHIVPAAFPRATPFLPLPELPQWSPDKDAFKAAVHKTVRDVLAVKEAQCRGDLDGMQPNAHPMWVCVNRYVRRGLPSRGGVTLFLAHANGFPKEIWEPMLARLVADHSENANYNVDEIWSWEAANHGDSCLLNKDALGGIYDWRDNSRDILQFLLHYLPSTASADELPTHLPRLPDEEAELRKAHGLQHRNMLYVGHSFGACSLVRVAIEFPVLFTSLFLVEAMVRHVHPKIPFSTETIARLVTGAVQRRDGWSSREEAHNAFSATPFFQAWDPATLAVYVACGLHEESGQARLKMPGIQEAVCFAEQHATHETFELLADLDPRVEMRWLIAGRLAPLDTLMRARAAWRRPANASHVVIPSSGHLITQEAPGEVAKELHTHLTKRYGTAKALL